MNLSQIVVRPIHPSEEARYQDLLKKYHYLGSMPKIGKTIWYVATSHDEWVALLNFSAAAWKCSARDSWIGWDYRHQYDRLNLLANNSRFLILPDWHIPNLGSRVISLSQKRLCRDWQRFFGHPLLLIETFVDPQHFHGTVYRASNWIYVGNTKGFSRNSKGYTAKTQSVKMVFVKPLHSNAQTILSNPILEPTYHIGGESKIMLTAAHMESLPGFFSKIPDPRRGQGTRHSLRTVLAIAAAATLCGMNGYKAIHDWAKNLGTKARARFGCRHRNGKYIIPSESIIRNVLIRVDPVHLDEALQRWNEVYAQQDESLAIDGKTMCNAIDDGHQTHIMSVVGHNSKVCYTQKKSASSL